MPVLAPRRRSHDRRGLPWEEWIFGALVIGGLCVVPTIFLAKGDGTIAGVGDLALRMAWVFYDAFWSKRNAIRE